MITRSKALIANIKGTDIDSWIIGQAEYE